MRRDDMRHLKAKPPLWQVSVKLPLESEDAVMEALGEVFGADPAIYVDAETQIATAQVFLLAKPSTLLLSKLQQRLAKLRSFGLAASRPAVQRLRAQDWAESWKRHFHPLDIGGRLLIRPSWSKRRPRKGQVVMVLDPGLSFGTGQHATTRFCLEQIVRDRRRANQQSFLDVGTGSGILAIAAAKMGYRPVHAFDIDPDAVAVAIQNSRKNSVIKQGRIQRRDVAQIGIPRHRYDLVCANLIYDALLENKTQIIAQLKSGGTLLLAGILRSQFKAVAKAYTGAGLELVSKQTKGEWKSGAFLLRKEQASSRKAVTLRET